LGIDPKIPPIEITSADFDDHVDKERSMTLPVFPDQLISKSGRTDDEEEDQGLTRACFTQRPTMLSLTKCGRGMEGCVLRAQNRSLGLSFSEN
jgi:hypothetical protein